MKFLLLRKEKRDKLTGWYLLVFFTQITHNTYIKNVYKNELH